MGEPAIVHQNPSGFAAVFFVFPASIKQAFVVRENKKTHENSWVLIQIAEREGFEPPDL